MKPAWAVAVHSIKEKSCLNKMLSYCLGYEMNSAVLSKVIPQLKHKALIRYTQMGKRFEYDTLE
eukprot:2022289-Lingulodinium_polyedra.AAC.1